MRFVLLILFLAPSVLLASEEQLFPCTAENAARNLPIAKGTLLVCYFGSKPKLKEDDWIYVVGVSFDRAIEGAKTPEFLAQADEFSLGVDYRLKNDQLEIVYYLATFPEFKIEKFYSDTIYLSELPARHEKRLLFRPRQVSREEAVKAANFLKSDEGTVRKKYQVQGPALIYEKLFKLRDYAFVDPVGVAAEMKKLENYWWNDGEIAEVFGSIYDNVLTIRQIKKIERH